MKHPTSKQVQTVIDNFKKVLPMANFEGHLDMSEYKVSPSCGTPMCHAGWYGAAVCVRHFISGATKMAEALGFYTHYHLLHWANRNPKLWGSKHGRKMFDCYGENDAFSFPVKSLQDIVTHWEGVRDRLRALEESLALDDLNRSVKLKKDNPPQPGETYPERPEPIKA